MRRQKNKPGTPRVPHFRRALPPLFPRAEALITPAELLVIRLAVDRAGREWPPDMSVRHQPARLRGPFRALLVTSALLWSAASAVPTPLSPPPWASLTGVVPGLDCPALVGGRMTDTTTAPSTLPRELHFVWVGGRSFPPKYCASLASFVDCLAGDAYTINLWTDGGLAPAACLLPEVRVRDATALAAASPPLAAALAARPNVGYKADLVRYAVLAAEGGVYSDIDATCLRSPVEAW